MKEVQITDAQLRKAAESGMDDFVQLIADAINGSIGSLTAETMSELNSDQLTLLAYMILRDEVMDGGFIQLIYNGYGGFIFHNPTDKALKLWGLDDLAQLLRRGRKLYDKHHESIERECTDEEFMSLFERFSEFDELDDSFVENEEQWSNMVAFYVDDHLDNFIKIV